MNTYIEDQAAAGGVMEADVPQQTIDWRTPALGLVMLSTLLSHNGELGMAELKEELIEHDVEPQRVFDCFKKTLERRNMVVRDGDTLSVTERGVDLVHEHADEIDDAYREVADMKVFAPGVYRMLSLLDDEKGPQGWLFDRSKNPTPQKAYAYVAEKLGLKPDTSGRKMTLLHTMNYIEVVYGDVAGFRNATNVRLTKKGRERLQCMRDSFREEIIKLEGVTPEGEVVPEFLSGDELRNTLYLLTDELANRMRILDRPVPDFTRIENGTEEEMRAAITRLRPALDRLEEQIDDKNPHVLSPRKWRRAA